MGEHHAHLLAMLIDVHLFVGDVHAVEGDGAAGGNFQQIQAAQEGGLAGAGGSDDDHLIPGVDMFTDVIQHQIVPKGLTQVFNVDHFDAASFPECPAAN